MNASERRAEIMRILIARRKETMCELAEELCVTDRTIRTDVSILTVDYPLETVRGHGGCVKLADWYRPGKRVLSQEQTLVLNELIPIATAHQAKVLAEILRAYA